MVVGAIFFLAGTVGLLRFPDSFTRLHALTKADNLGLGLVVAGLMLQATGVQEVLKLLLVWLLVLQATRMVSAASISAALVVGVVLLLVPGDILLLPHGRTAVRANAPATRNCWPCWRSRRGWRPRRCGWRTNCARRTPTCSAGWPISWMS